jgi:hypothetical protein
MTKPSSPAKKPIRKVGRPRKTSPDESSPKTPELVAEEDLIDESSATDTAESSVEDDTAESSVEDDIDESSVEDDIDESSADPTDTEPIGKQYKNLTKLGATKGEVAKALAMKENDTINCDQRAMDILIASKQDSTPSGDRTERCSFQVKLQVSKMMLKTIQHHLKPQGGGTYTDVALKEAFNLYFYKQWNEFMSRELVENFQDIYSNKKSEFGKVIAKIIDVPDDYFQATFMNGFLTSDEAVAVMEEKQRLHERQLNQKRKQKSKTQAKADAKKDFADMSKDEQDAFLAELMSMKK